MNKGRDINYEDAHDEFIRHCKLRNLSDKTIDYYKEVLDVFIKFRGHNEFLVKEINREIIDEYILYLKDSGIKDISVNTRLRGIRAFIYWCMERDYLDKYKIKLIKEEEVIKETYTDTEMKLLLKKPNIKTCSFSEYRNWVMINFLIGTGVRLLTLISINIEDLDIENGVFSTSHNKNRKQQIIPISSVLNKILGDYLLYRSHDSDEEPLFCTEHGKRYTTSGCRSAIVRYGRNRGVERCGVHKFRHTFAKNWILSGGDVFRLQKILNHSSMDVVRKYVNIYGKDLQKDFDKYNILDRLSDEKEHIKLR